MLAPLSNDSIFPYMSHILRGTSVVAVTTLLSRLLGFIRDLLVAALFGASQYADAFFVAFRIPNLLRSFVAEGALTSAFVPIFSDANKNGKQAAQNTFELVLTFLLVVTIILSILGIYFAGDIVSMLAPGFQSNPEKYSLAVLLTQLMFPYVIFISVVALVNGALNTLHIFGAGAWAQVVMNLVLIFGAIPCFFVSPMLGTILLAISVLFGGFFQILFQVPALNKGGLKFGLQKNIFSREIGDLLKLMLPAIIGASIYQISIFMSTLLASLLPEGSVSWLFYADRVAQFPLGIFSIALSSVLLPLLANDQAADNKESFARNLGNSLRYTSFVIMPFSALLLALAEPIVALLFERGAFSAESSRQTALALQALALGLWATSCHSMLVKAFIARKDTVTPTVVGAVSLVVGLLAGLILMGPVVNSGSVSAFILSLQHFFTEALGYEFNLRHVGLALSSSISAWMSLALLMMFFVVRNGISLSQTVFISSITSFLASGVAWCLTGYVAKQLENNAAKICISSFIGMGAYVVIQALLRNEELRQIWKLLAGTRFLRKRFS